MAQTKKQRFREQKRAAKSPAPKPVATKAPVKKVQKSATEPMAGKKKLIIGAGALVAVLGAAGAVFLLSAPSTPAAAEAKPAPTSSPTPPVVKREPDAAFYRSMLIRDYKVKVDQEVAEKVFKSCTSGESVTSPTRIRGVETTVTITCADDKLKVIDAQSKKEILTEQPPPPPAPTPTSRTP